jgi:hypothetical protein
MSWYAHRSSCRERYLIASGVRVCFLTPASQFNQLRCPVGDNVEPMALTENDITAIRLAIEKDAAAERRADWDAGWGRPIWPCRSCRLRRRDFRSNYRSAGLT